MVTFITFDLCFGLCFVNKFKSFELFLVAYVGVIHFVYDVEVLGLPKMV